MVAVVIDRTAYLTAKRLLSNRPYPLPTRTVFFLHFEDMSTPAMRRKLVVVGDVACGKVSLILSLCA
jgi:GTPase SAR1 family protein